jgi:hypothetical protein
MSNIIDERMAAKIDGDFVVFLIGMRINKPWKLHKWGPVFLAMGKMVKELEAYPVDETGFLGHNGLNTQDDRAVLAQLRPPGGLCSRSGSVALSGLGRVQQAYEAKSRRRRHLARNVSH